ncbi:hypothetical protein HPP92_022662 [Vanilla planifolia]|uniref:Uncharacterized protein n=1 Tax=Vanilla planifolia TaxID=51239 RepID=A0A835PNZ0_VANPL|nr:hypothetical protein HPP92_022662 [Vanilla planifolia]
MQEGSIPSEMYPEECEVLSGAVFQRALATKVRAAQLQVQLNIAVGIVLSNRDEYDSDYEELLLKLIGELACGFAPWNVLNWDELSEIKELSNLIEVLQVVIIELRDQFLPALTRKLLVKAFQECSQPWEI